MIEINNLEKFYGKNKVLDIPNLIIEDGEVAGLVGNNGVGKSTLLRIIAGISHLTVGSCKYNGKETTNNLQCSKDIVLIDEKMSYCGKVKLGNILQEYNELIDGFDLEKAKKYMQEFKLNEDMKQPKLSKGMTNIFNLIIGFCLPHKVILYDEITSGLDEYARRKFNKLLTQETLNGEKTYILSTHLFGEISDITNKVILIKNGKVLMHESIENLSGKMMRIRGLNTDILPILKENRPYETKEVCGYCEAIIDAEISRKIKTYMEERSIEKFYLSASETCAILANCNHMEVKINAVPKTV